MARSRKLYLIRGVWISTPIHNRCRQRCKRCLDGVCSSYSQRSEGSGVSLHPKKVTARLFRKKTKEGSKKLMLRDLQYL